MTTLRLHNIPFFALLPAALLLAGYASAQTTIFDTGQPTQTGGGEVLCASTCGGGATFQNVAGQFTLTEGYAVSSAQAWIQGPATGGQLAVVIRSDASGAPGAAVFSQTYTVPNQATSTWVAFTFTNQPVLAASTTYWLSFEPVAGSGISYSLPGGAPNPLPAYGFYNSRNSGWVINENENVDPGYGMRLYGSAAASPTLLIDTGAPTSTANGAGIYNTGTSNYEYLAGQFTLSQAASISSVEGWMQVGVGGGVNVNIYSGNGPLAFGGDFIPGTSIFIQSFTIPSSPFGANGGWVSFPLSAPNPVLPAGTYWVSLEPTVGNFNATMFDGAPSPLPNYAYNFNLNGDWVTGSINTPPFSMGFRVYGNTFAPVVSGTAARTIETGEAFGFPDTPQDIITGADGQADTFSYNFIIPSGWSEARGTIIPNGLQAGAYSDQSGPCFSPPCTVGAGAGRGIAYRTWLNTSTESLPFVINAVLDGEFQNGGGVVSAGIYVIDANAFNAAVAASGLPTPQFLLNSSTLSALTVGAPGLAALFPAPGAVLLNHLQNIPVEQTGSLITVPIAASSTVNVAPGEAIVVMFDVSAYAGAGGDANFASTLAPSPTLPLIADSTGQNPLSQLLAVGPSAPVTTTPATLTLTPSTASNPVGATGSVTATAKDPNGLPVAGALVFFAFNSGPNAGPAGPLTTDANGNAVFTYTGNGGAGTDIIQATLGTITATPASISWTLPGVLDHITISPATASIASGGTQPYTAQGFDRLNDTLGDVTAATTFSITPDGSCTGAVCTATVAGPHTVMGNDNGKTAQATLTVGVVQTTPVITWATPAAITYGTALGATQLNATANVAGSFLYSPGAATVLTAGNQMLSVTFTPTDTTHYTTASATVTLVVNKATPVVTWATPAPITYGTAMGATQLNASASVPGAFVYTPGIGAVLTAGSQSLGVTFTPTDATDYSTASAGVTLVVNKATPVVTWAAPAPITYGTALGAAQLNASASVPGAFVYTPGTGAVLTAGSQSLGVTFTPTDATDYSTASAGVTLVVNKATPVITWATPAPIASGTPLSAAQLNATASVPGTFIYTPPSGTVLNPGNQTLSLSFTPTDTVDYVGAGAQVILVVNTPGKTTPVITWATPAPISYGTPLTSAQLNATANTAGTFVYSPKAGTVLTAGSQTLTVTFTPSNTSAYNSATSSVTLQVNRATPAVLWVPVPIVYGTPLGQLQLDALTLVPGTFTYTPPAGTILGAGEQKLAAVFTPKDTVDFQTINVQGTLVVLKAEPQISWAEPASITAGTPLSATQLNATANVPGTFSYNPPLGTKLGAGTATLTATFTPKDSADYQTEQAEVRITVKAH